MNFLFRRSTSIAATSAARRSVASALISSNPLIFQSEFFTPTAAPPAGAFQPSAAAGCGFSCIGRREIHFSVGPLGFRASDVASAEHAVDDFYDDDSLQAPGRKKADEGLEIAKLGISKAIILALEKKGITKLFPSFCWGYWELIMATFEHRSLFLLVKPYNRASPLRKTRAVNFFCLTPAARNFVDGLLCMAYEVLSKVLTSILFKDGISGGGITRHCVRKKVIERM